MRPKVMLTVLLLAFGLLGVVALISRALRPQAASSPSDIGITAPSDSNQSASATLAKRESVRRLERFVHAAQPIAEGATNSAAPDDPVHAEYVRQRTAELEALSMNNDTASRDTILSEMTNPDKAIRNAALEAAIQFGDRSVVPRLQEIAAQTEDPAEKADILAAIDYINLPSFSEHLAQQKANMAAMGVTNMPSSQRPASGSGPRHGQSQATTNGQ